MWFIESHWPFLPHYFFISKYLHNGVSWRQSILCLACSNEAIRLSAFSVLQITHIHLYKVQPFCSQHHCRWEQKKHGPSCGSLCLCLLVFHIEINILWTLNIFGLCVQTNISVFRTNSYQKMKMYWSMGASTHHCMVTLLWHWALVFQALKHSTVQAGTVPVGGTCLDFPVTLQ